MLKALFESLLIMLVSCAILVALAAIAKLLIYLLGLSLVAYLGVFFIIGWIAIAVCIYLDRQKPGSS